MNWKLQIAAAGALFFVVTAAPVMAQPSEGVIQIAAKKMRGCPPRGCQPLGGGQYCCKNLRYACRTNPKGLCLCTESFLPATCGITTTKP